MRLGNFWPKGHSLHKLGKGPLVDATYQITKALGHLGFSQEDFMFSYISLHT